MQKIIAPSKALGYSNLYLDFLAEKPSARKFFLSGGYSATAAEIDAREYPRAQMVEILRRQNKEFGASAAAMGALERLADPRAICVVAGQQAGFFTQCTMVQLKAFGAAKRAARLEKELNRPVVPIFWIAGDDHDFAEVAQVCVINQSGATEILPYGATQEINHPIGLTRLSDENALAEILRRYKEDLGESEFTPELYRLIDQSYTSRDTFVTAFGKLMAALTAPYGIVYFSPTDPAVSRVASPFYQTLIEKNSAVRDLIQTTNREIVDEGYSLQVEKSDTASHLFHTGSMGRTPISTDGGQFVVEGQKLSAQQLRALAENSPEQLTPDVLLRPVMQSLLFPVVVQYGGPSEIAYLAQMNRLFSLFEYPTPVHLPRPTASLVEKKHEKAMLELGISIEELYGDIEQAVNRVMEKSFPKDLEGKVELTRSEIAASFERLTKESLAFDPTLEEFAKQTAGKVDFSVKTFGEKVFAAHKRRSKETRDKIYRLEAALHPLRGPQDRAINIGYFIAKYGIGVVSFLYDRIDIDQTGHQLLYLSEMKD